MSMSAITVNRDVQPREFLSMRPVPSGLGTRQDFSWSGQSNNGEVVELLLPGNEVIVPSPGANYQLFGSWLLYDMTNPVNTEVTGASEVFAGFRFTVRANGSVVFTQGYNGFNAGAPPGNNSLGLDLVPLPLNPGTRYLRLRLQGTSGSIIMAGVYARLIGTPRIR